MRRVALGLCAASLALSACGSTVQPTGSATLGQPGFSAPGGTSGDGLSLGTTSTGGSGGGSSSGAGTGTTGAFGAGSSTGATSTTGTTGAGGSTGSGGSTGTSSGFTTGAGTTTGSSTSKLPGRHKAVSDSTIKVGFLYLANAGTVVGGFGVQGYSQGDELGVFQALIKDQNDRGGVAGRKLEVVPRDLGGIDDASFQAACTFFTQDQPVFMVLTALGHSALLNECLAKADVGFTSNYIAPPDRLMRQLGPIYAPDDIAAERYGALLARSLIEAKFFGAGAKVGIIRSDTPDYKRITAEIVRPILQSAGVDVVAEETFSPTDASKAIGDAPAVVFRLQQKGVTHVLSYESPLFYMTAAESQSWRPFWTVTSRAGAGSFLEGAAPKEQLKKALGPGWQPVSDLATSRIKGTINSEEARCLATAKAAGYEYVGTPRYVLQMLCGELYHFARVLARASEVSTAGFRSSAEALPPYPSPMTFGMSFAGGRHDGASLYRIVAWQASCECFLYTSPLRPMPTS